MKLNWKVRLGDKAFWLTLIPALALLVTAICRIFGIELDLSDLVNKIVATIEALFVVLAILGIVRDPTTEGLGDSNRALTYKKPWTDK